LERKRLRICRKSSETMVNDFEEITRAINKINLRSKFGLNRFKYLGLVVQKNKDQNIKIRLGVNE